MSELEKQELEKQELEKQEQKKIQEPQLVDKKAYIEVRGDMMKYKNELKDIKVQMTQMQAEKEAIENDKLAEQGRWEDLYKQQTEKVKTMTSERANENEKFINYHKKNSVLNKIGGFKRDEYNKFIDTEKISLNEDGSIEESSLNFEIDRIKQSYPELLKNSKNERLPNDDATLNSLGDKQYSSMSEAERLALKRNLLRK